MNYIQEVKEMLDEKLKMSGTEYEDLLEVYTLLVLIKGIDCTNEDVHDAWSVWQNKIDPTHQSLTFFEGLTEEVQELDSKYRDAIITVSNNLIRLT